VRLPAQWSVPARRFGDRAGGTGRDRGQSIFAGDREVRGVSQFERAMRARFLWWSSEHGDGKMETGRWRREDGDGKMETERWRPSRWTVSVRRFGDRAGGAGRDRGQSIFAGDRVPGQSANCPASVEVKLNAMERALANADKSSVVQASMM